MPKAQGSADEDKLQQEKRCLARGTLSIRVSQAPSQPTWPAAPADPLPPITILTVFLSDKEQQGSSSLQQRAHAVFFLPGAHGRHRRLQAFAQMSPPHHLKFPHGTRVLVFPFALTVEFHLPQ